MTDISKEAVAKTCAELRASRATWEDGKSRPSDRETAAAAMLEALSAERDALEADVTTYQAIVRDLTAEGEALSAKLAGVTAQLDTLAGASVEAIGTAAHAAKGWQHWMHRAEAAEASNAALKAEVERLRVALVAISEETDPPQFYKDDRRPTKTACIAITALKGDKP